MTWNVYFHNINRKEIEAFDIFKHNSFYKDVKDLLKRNLPYNEFCEELRRTVMYYFWSKAEYEIVVTSWVPYIDNEELDRLISERNKHECYSYYVDLDVGSKVDIYDQLCLNWERFAEYVYSFSKANRKVALQ